MKRATTTARSIATTLLLSALASAPAASQVPAGTPRAPDAEWTTYGLDQAETRFSTLAQVNAGNVDRLEVAWSYQLPRRGARLEATPLVADGVMYASGPKSTVFALDARTGEEIWYWDPAIPDEEAGGPPACCGDVNRGLAMHGDKIFAGLLDGRLVALNRETGRAEWSAQTTPPGTDYSITGAPRVFRVYGKYRQERSQNKRNER